MSNKRFTFDRTSQMSDMLTTHPMLVMLLPRFGLSLGFGDKSVGEVCDMAGVDADFFVLTCGIYATGGMVPDKARVLSTSLRQLVTYLQRSHDFYVNSCLPHIAGHMQHIAERLPERAGKALLQFFDNYRSEMREHFTREERTIFPYITALQDGKTANTVDIDAFLANHERIETKFEDLLQIIFKYLPHEVADEEETLNVVYDILQVSGDLRCHAIVEERVMVPYVLSLESKQQ